MAAPTRAKQRLGAHLRQLRIQADVSALDAGAQLKAADSTVTRYETGHVLPAWGSVRTLLDCYNASDQDRATVSRLWDDARDEPPQVRLPAGMPKSLRRFLNAERDATDVKAIEPLVMPGLLQTEGYMRAVNEVAARYVTEDARLESYVNLRMNRQRRLEGSNPLRLHAVIDEGVIRRIVGSPITMRRQLEHLLSMSERPNITVQVVSEEAGVYGTMSGSANVIIHTDGTPGVYLEYPAGGSWMENEKDVRKFTTMFDDAVEIALSPAETADLIMQRVRVLEGR